MEQPYHKYIFDTENRKFVGKFEEMYKNEDIEGYDSWFQEDSLHLEKILSLEIIKKYIFNSILDIGCGKGAFTKYLKKPNNHVLGVDISETAIKKARDKYNNIEFRKLSADEALSLPQKWDLIIILEVLSYLENWKRIIERASEKTKYLYISLYLPADPIGYVKDFEALRGEIGKYFSIETELIKDRESMFILGKNKKGA